MTTWIWLIVILGVFLGVYYLLQWALGKWLHLGKRRHYRTYHNETHKKWDVRMRLVSALIIVVGYLWVMDNGFIGSYWNVHFLTLGSGVILQELCRAYMEWKYSEQRREYIRVLASAGYVLVFLFTSYVTNLFGLV
ncbi:DUF4181 domain-containing protein [Rossellomorea marisflavi]|uniref:DUF4181 domain-containing protein n=1 Tax=Rossellomorea marisflavi TaxID=189381 RepID=UPI00203CE629|nr:DUF4181 domain-containing protein [Rossellomorea marisflavi]MCM2603199.1 DUF4181 domain-containing protein [Rossellomorea marisflavi]